jgi:CubicO group peptidase (beta-lactamase class C family)
MARGHDEDWKPTPDLEIPAMQGAGALRSSANDLAKYVAANVGLLPSELAPLMREMQVVRHHSGTLRWGNTAMPWNDHGAYSPPGSDLTGHGGGTGGFATFIGLDKQQRRGVVVLSNQERIHSSILGFRILQHARLDRLDPVKMMHVQQITGVGLVLGVDEQSHMLVVKGTQPKSPSARANVVAGSIIESIDGVPTAGKTLPENAALIRGESGTIVQLALKEPNESEPKTVKITREKFLIGE